MMVTIYDGHTLYSVAQLSSPRKYLHICKKRNTAKIIKTTLFDQELAERGKNSTGRLALLVAFCISVRR